jgi:hypothetical protein
LQNVSVAGEPFLKPDAALALAIDRVSPLGTPVGSPTIERIVFPAQLTGGLPEGAFDRRLVVHARPAAPYVWAYQANLELANHRVFSVIVDGNTGQILRNTEIRESFAPIASRGTGLGMYAGAVPVDASQLADGTYALYDTTRGTLPNPWLERFTPDDSGWTPVGMQAWFEAHDSRGNPLGSAFLFQQNPVNDWGDGQPFTAWSNENGRNGQTAGVDALYGTAAAWDFFKIVFGRDGFDGRGTTAVAAVLQTSPLLADNAFFSPFLNVIFLGAGSYPRNPDGLASVTDLEIVAHEWVHAITFGNQLISSDESEEGGIVEGTCDFFSQIIEAWAAGPRTAVIPDTGTDWLVGKGITHGGFLRSLVKPSRNPRVPDGWYGGIAPLEPHSKGGPIGRALYFLAQGASGNPADESYSPFLPQGMAGIGNDAAARIWYKAVVEHLFGDLNGKNSFADARAAGIAASLELYPDDPAKTVAVENAFAAVNVGDAHGAPPHTLVLFADFRDGDWINRAHDFYSNRQVLPRNETVAPRITVLNNANTAVTWSLGGLSLWNGANQFTTSGGVINPDGTWTTPNESSWHAITATSVADPKQFAEGRAFLINIDMDTDLEQDAIDMGGIAVSWFLGAALNPAHSVFTAPFVDDTDVAYFVDAYRSTWPAK